MLEALTGTGLAGAAGLNAYIPLLAIGLLDRYTNVITLPSGWTWLSNGWVLIILGVLLAVELVADKVPVVDHVNDVVQTVVRPTAGGLAFTAGASSETVTVTDPGSFFESKQWIPMLIGFILAGSVHLIKALSRPVINTFTLGLGAPVVSTAEDATSATLSVVAIILPILVIVFLIGFVWLGWWVLTRRKRARARASTEYYAS
ncbi:MAG: DUF4126 domain-containing protein [Hamadaea sp.]|nr:DUF4126 domain-containing protein [Hamadaea sp.]